MPTDEAMKPRFLNAEGRLAVSGRFMNDFDVLALPVFIPAGVPPKTIEAMTRGKAVAASPELVDGRAIADGK
jgi:hypothetical protein